MTMNKGESTRLDRIEEKIDKLSDAVVSIARAEEKLAGLESLNIEQHRKLQDLDDRLRTVETKVHDAQQSLNVFNKVFWIAISAGITAVIGMILMGTTI